MSYFFCDQNLSVGQEINLSGEESRHIFLSRRTKVGQQVNLQGPDGARFAAEVTHADKKILGFKILNLVVVPVEPKVPLVLFLSVISEQALDFVLQKGTELGLGKLVLFNSANTATKLTREIFQKKIIRWEKIVKEAAKQSDRAMWPKVEFLSGLTEVKQELLNYDKIILFDIVGTNTSLIERKSGLKAVAMVIGPEGGFTEQEVDELKILPNAELINLGPVLLRAETASLAGLVVARMLIK